MIPNLVPPFPAFYNHGYNVFQSHVTMWGISNIHKPNQKPGINFIRIEFQGLPIPNIKVLSPPPHKKTHKKANPPIENRGEDLVKYSYLFCIFKSPCSQQNNNISSFLHLKNSYRLYWYGILYGSRLWCRRLHGGLNEPKWPLYCRRSSGPYIGIGPKMLPQKLTPLIAGLRHGSIFMGYSDHIDRGWLFQKKNQKSKES